MVSLEEIIKDRRSGQSAILKKTVELLKGIDAERRLSVCEEIAKVHKFMAGLKWLCERIREGFDLEDIEREIEKADKEAVKYLEDLVDGKIVVTISRSHTIERGLLKASKVIVLESFPRKEGLDMARYLKGRSVDVSIFPDCAMGYAVKVCDLAVVGADAVFKNGIINKVGTLPLALCCRHFSKDCHVIAQPYKFLDEVYSDELKDYVFKEDMLFEFVPKELVKI
ncbi:eIF2B alpha/beta/delta subunit family protein [Archaeoglobus profundus]|uniref:Initiation factor 2B related protein n=1 Tax=Archaeoglobus profundus (strain DSM 5631 / JCM 9629 / NBRC 100127 / Av18) TaxID=572546 RepID=D2RDC1_ARCPA|nr:initiation factor 2B related protein [Archaeoglobus profundus]ADB58115.1 initiation factor 2B related protein [Archaeoglobus profundus DSM 5631]